MARVSVPLVTPLTAQMEDEIEVPPLTRTDSVFLAKEMLEYSSDLPLSIFASSEDEYVPASSEASSDESSERSSQKQRPKTSSESKNGSRDSREQDSDEPRLKTGTQAKRRLFSSEEEDSVESRLKIETQDKMSLFSIYCWEPMEESSGESSEDEDHPAAPAGEEPMTRDEQGTSEQQPVEEQSSRGEESVTRQKKGTSKRRGQKRGSRRAKNVKRKWSTEEVKAVEKSLMDFIRMGVVIVGEDTVGHYDLGIFVASIVPGGPADKDGRIRTGGRLISLNHISLEGVTFSEAAEVMQSSPEEVQLIISQPKVGLSPNSLRSSVLRNHESNTTLMTDGRSGDDSLDDIMPVMMTPRTGNRLHVPRDVRIPGPQDRPEEITVELRKISGSLGISISGGVNTNLPNGGIYIRSLVPGGAAERDGRIHSGDRLLEVDRINFQGFTYQQAVECLSKTGEVVTLVLERVSMNLPRVSLSADTNSSASNQSMSPATSRLRINSCSSISTGPNTISDQSRDYSFVTDDNTQEVTLTKSANSLGFSFIMCELDPPTRDFGSLVRIKQLFPGQPAQQSGRIQEGDVLLAINGQSLKELSYPRVLKLFKTSPPVVRLTLSRPAPGLLPSIDHLTGT